MKTILIVDDDKKGILPLAIRLKAAGYAVEMAFDGAAGLKLAVQLRPDLILMDIWMPQGMGILTAQRVKHFGLENVPVIFLTASRKEEIWPIVEDVRPAGFFEKPYDSKEIIAAIGTILRQSNVQAPEMSATPIQNQPQNENHINCRR
jgi:DNA-binding response OmpR family regulator